MSVAEDKTLDMSLAEAKTRGEAVQRELQIAMKVITVLTHRLGDRTFISDAEIEDAPSIKAWRDGEKQGVFLVVGDEADDLIDAEIAGHAAE